MAIGDTWKRVSKDKAKRAEERLAGWRTRVTAGKKSKKTSTKQMEKDWKSSGPESLKSRIMNRKISGKKKKKK